MLPLEPMEERYTGQWWEWLPKSLGVGFDNVTVIAGQALRDRITVGAFLDLNSTAHYKATQLARVAQLFAAGSVKSGDAFWVSDIEFWGIESIRYLARLQGIKVFMFGFLHAASYTTEDFMAPMADIGAYLEPAWVAAFDRVYVGSEYHKYRVTQARLSAAPFGYAPLGERIVVTGNPWRTREVAYGAGARKFEDRDIDICFPHRPDREKRPGVFLRAALSMQRHRGNALKIAFTTGRESYTSTNDPLFIEEVKKAQDSGLVEIHTNLNRPRFYDILGRSKVVVSTAIEENFGYAMLEGMAMGAIPVMPYNYSYPELVAKDRRFLYLPNEDSNKVSMISGHLAKALALTPEQGAELSALAQSLAARYDASEALIHEDMQKTMKGSA